MNLLANPHDSGSFSATFPHPDRLWLVSQNCHHGDQKLVDDICVFLAVTSQYHGAKAALSSAVKSPEECAPKLLLVKYLLVSIVSAVVKMVYELDYQQFRIWEWVTLRKEQTTFFFCWYYCFPRLF
jgi:hypothetical protein